MTTPDAQPAGQLPDEQGLAPLLATVDDSRARMVAAEDQLTAEAEQVYAEAAAAYVAAQGAPAPEAAPPVDDGHPILTAAVLAAVVAAARKAFALGTMEGTRAVSEQLASLGLDFSKLVTGTVVAPVAVVDGLVAQFLAGQSEAATKATSFKGMVLDMAARAKLCLTASLYAGRGAAAQAALALLDAVVPSPVHKLWVARFDISNVCGWCARLHGMHVAVADEFPRFENEPERLRYDAPLRHPNCRCMLVMFFPALQLTQGPSPASMMFYGDDIVRASNLDPNDFVRATVVHVKGYSRVVNGKMQQVKGYYYDVETGLKLPDGDGSALPAKEVSAAQAKAITAKSKNAAASGAPAPASKFGPGTYKIDLPDDSASQLIVHKDGTSSAIYGDQVEEVNPSQTKQFLNYWDAQGKVTKVSESDGLAPGAAEDLASQVADPTVTAKDLGVPQKTFETLQTGLKNPPYYEVLPGFKTASQGDAATAQGLVYYDPVNGKQRLTNKALKAFGITGVDPAEGEASSEAKAAGSIAEGFYVFSPKKGKYEGIEILPDGKGVLYSEGFSKKLTVHKATVNGIEKGHLGDLTPVPEEDFNSDWQKSYDGAKAADETNANLPGLGANAPASAYPSAGVKTVTGGEAQFKIGTHYVQFPEGSQAFRSSSAKDTLYVLDADGNLTKYNPQGKGVQATLVGSAANPAARADILAKLDNVSDEGVQVDASVSVAGETKAVVGGVPLSAAQLDAAIGALSASDTSSTTPVLAKIGSPLAATDLHAVAAPFKASYNNKTKPALLAALKAAHAKTGAVPSSQAGAVEAFQSAHELDLPDVNLGKSDLAALSAAAEAISPPAPGASAFKGSAPGTIGIKGVPFSPHDVSAAIDLLKAESSTSVKGPLKKGGNPLAGADLQGMANDLAGSKVHYGKLKPAVIKALQDALDDHHLTAPEKPVPTIAEVPQKPAVIAADDGFLTISPEQVLEAKQAFAEIDFSAAAGATMTAAPAIYKMVKDKKESTPSLQSNPLFGSTVDVLEMGYAVNPNMTPASLNADIDASLAQVYKQATGKDAAPVAKGGKKLTPDPAAKVSLGEVEGTVGELLELRAALENTTLFSKGGMAVAVKKDIPNNSFAKTFQNVDGPAADLWTKMVPNIDADNSMFVNKKKIIVDQIDKALDELANPTPGVDPKVKNLAPAAPSLAPAKGATPGSGAATVTVGSLQVGAADLQDALDALKAEPSTSIKKPLKGTGNPLATVNLKELTEAYHGGPIHYGKLKPAVIQYLEEKKASLPAIPPPLADDDGQVIAAPDAPALAAPHTEASGGLTLKGGTHLAPGVYSRPGVNTKFKITEDGKVLSMDWNEFLEEWDENPISAFELPQEKFFINDGTADGPLWSLEGAPAASVEPTVPEEATPDLSEHAGVWTMSNGATLVVSPDGGAVFTGGGWGDPETAVNAATAQMMINDGGFTKTKSAPSETNPSQQFTKSGVQVGKYVATSATGAPVTYYVLPSGAIYAQTPDGGALMTDAQTIDSPEGPAALIKSLGVEPSGPADPPAWLTASSGFAAWVTPGDPAPAGLGPSGGPEKVNGAYIGKYLVMSESGSSQVSTLSASGLDIGTPGKTSVFPLDHPISKAFLDEMVQKPSVVKLGQYQAEGETEKSFFTVYENGAVTFQSPYASEYHYANVTTDSGMADMLAGMKFLGGEPELPGPMGSDGYPLEEEQYYAPDSDFDEGYVDPMQPSGVTPGGALVGVYQFPSGTKFTVMPDGTVYPDAGLSNVQPQYLLTIAEKFSAGEDGWGSQITHVTSDTWKGPGKGDADAGDSSGTNLKELFETLANQPAETAGPVSFLGDPVAPVPQLPDDAVVMPVFSGPYGTAYNNNLDGYDKPLLLQTINAWVENSPFKGKIGFHLSSLPKNDIISWVKFVSNGQFDAAFDVEAQKVKNHKAKGAHPGDPKNPANKNGFTKPYMAPAVPGELPAGVLPEGAQWTTANPDFPSYSSPGPHQWDKEKIDQYLLAAGMQNPTGLNAHSKKMWASHHYSGNKMQVDTLSLKAKENVAKGNHLSEPVFTPVEVFPAGTPMPPIPGAPELNPAKAYATDWSVQQLDAYIKHVAPPKVAKHFLKQDEATKQGLVSLHNAAAASPSETTFVAPSVAKEQFDSIVSKISATEDYNLSVDQSDFVSTFEEIISSKGEHTYTLDAEQPKLNGFSEFYHVSDEKNNKYLFKVAKSPAAGDAENAAHTLAGMAGIPAASSTPGSFQGKTGAFQRKIDHKATLEGVTPSVLSASELSSLMRSHVFDWAVHNDSSADRSFMLTADGKVVPADLSRAFAEFGSPNMALKRGSVSGRAHSIYEDVYAAMVSGAISEKDTDKVYSSMIAQAKRMEGIPDSDWQFAVLDGLQSRTDFSNTSASSAPDLVKQATARKASLVADFEAFWDDLYAEMGRPKPEKLSAFADAQSTFSGNDQQWHQHAAQMGHTGAASFFAGTDLEDGHLLAQVVAKPAAKQTAKPAAPAQIKINGKSYKPGIYGSGDWELTLHADGTIEDDDLAAELGMESKEQLFINLLGEGAEWSPLPSDAVSPAQLEAIKANYTVSVGSVQVKPGTYETSYGGEVKVSWTGDVDDGGMSADLGMSPVEMFETYWDEGEFTFAGPPLGNPPSAASAPQPLMTSDGVAVGQYKWAGPDFVYPNATKFKVNSDGHVLNSDGAPMAEAFSTMIKGYIKDGKASLIAPEFAAPEASGDNELWLSGKLRPDAAKKFEAWLAQNVTEKLNSGNGYNPPKPDKTKTFLDAQGFSGADNVLLQAGKTVSHHNKLGDKQYNTTHIAAMETLSNKVDMELQNIKNDIWPSTLQEVDKPAYKALMLHYKSRVDLIDGLKASGGKSKYGDFDPISFTLAPDPIVKPDVTKPPSGPKVVQRSNAVDQGKVGPDLKLVATGTKVDTAGNMYEITLPNGVVIEYQPAGEGTVASQKGFIRIKDREYDGQNGSTQTALDFLASTGLSVDAAEEEDMELFYWRHLFGILERRADRNEGKNGEVLAAAKKVGLTPKGGNVTANGTPAMDKAEELAAWRESWSRLTSPAQVEEFVAAGRYMPSFSHTNPLKPDEVGGPPFWYRFDVDLNDVYNNTGMPVKTSSHGSGGSTTMYKLVESGNLLSSEDRLRLLGSWTGGMSSSSDQGHDSSNQIYTRQGLGSTSFQYWFNPLITARTTSYSFNSDNFGDNKTKVSESGFAHDKVAKPWTVGSGWGSGSPSSGNELMIKHAVSLLDDVELISFNDKPERDKAVAMMKERGITTIRGLPIESRMVVSSDAASALKKVNEHRKTYKLEVPS